MHVNTNLRRAGIVAFPLLALGVGLCCWQAPSRAVEGVRTQAARQRVQIVSPLPLPVTMTSPVQVQSPLQVESTTLEPDTTTWRVAEIHDPGLANVINALDAMPRVVVVTVFYDALFGNFVAVYRAP